MSGSNGAELSPESVQPVPDVVVERVRSKQEQVADILKGAQTPTPEETPAPAEPDKPLDLKAAAEKLGIPPEKLYEMRIPIADGESLSIGEWKDGYKAVKSLETDRESYRKERSTLEADKLANQRELDALLNVLPAETRSPQFIEAAKQYLKIQDSLKEEGIFREIPDWSDAGIRSSDWKLMGDYVKAFGFEPSDLNKAYDPRLLKMVRHWALKEKDLKSVKEKLPELAKSKAPVSKSQSPAQKFGHLKAQVTSKSLSRTDAIAKILRGEA